MRNRTIAQIGWPRSLPVSYPAACGDDGWARLARTLRAEIEQDFVEAYRDTGSLPPEAGFRRRVAASIVDDGDTESRRSDEPTP